MWRRTARLGFLCRRLQDTSQRIEERQSLTDSICNPLRLLIILSHPKHGKWLPMPPTPNMFIFDETLRHNYQTYKRRGFHYAIWEDLPPNRTETLRHFPTIYNTCYCYDIGWRLLNDIEARPRSYDIEAHIVADINKPTWPTLRSPKAFSTSPHTSEHSKTTLRTCVGAEENASANHVR